MRGYIGTYMNFRRNLFVFVALISLNSCLTTDFYGKDTSTLTADINGKILISSAKSSTNDIYIDGKREISWGIMNIEWWKWIGKSSFNNMTYHIDVRYRGLVDEDDDLDGFDSVKIKKNDKYEFNSFKVPDAGLFASKLVRSTEMPFTLTSFFIEDREYFVNITSMRHFNLQEVYVDYVMNLMTLKNQIFQITNKKGELVAEFTNNDYKVFRVENEKDIEDFIYPIAVFCLIHKLCVGRNTYPFFR